MSYDLNLQGFVQDIKTVETLINPPQVIKSIQRISASTTPAGSFVTISEVNPDKTVINLTSTSGGTTPLPNSTESVDYVVSWSVVLLDATTVQFVRHGSAFVDVTLYVEVIEYE